MYVLLVLWWLVCCIHAVGQQEQCKSSAWCDAGGGLAVARPAAVAGVLELLCLLSGETGAAQCTAAAAVTPYIQ